MFSTKYGNDSRGFFMQIKKNDFRAPCFWKKWRFLTKYGHKSSLLSENGRFDKTLEWQQWFLVKKRKKGYPFWSIIQCSFDRLTLFLLNMGMTTGFLMKIYKNDMRAPCFWKNGRFLTKYEYKNSLFFLGWTFCHMGMREKIFS